MTLGVVATTTILALYVLQQKVSLCPCTPRAFAAAQAVGKRVRTAYAGDLYS